MLVHGNLDTKYDDSDPASTLMTLSAESEVQRQQPSQDKQIIGSEETAGEMNHSDSAMPTTKTAHTDKSHDNTPHLHPRGIHIPFTALTSQGKGGATKMQLIDWV